MKLHLIRSLYASTVIIQVPNPPISNKLTFAMQALISQSWTRRLSVLMGKKTQETYNSRNFSISKISRLLIDVYKFMYPLSPFACYTESLQPAVPGLQNWPLDPREPIGHPGEVTWHRRTKCGKGAARTQRRDGGQWGLQVFCIDLKRHSTPM